MLTGGDGDDHADPRVGLPTAGQLVPVGPTKSTRNSPAKKVRSTRSLRSEELDREHQSHVPRSLTSSSVTVVGAASARARFHSQWNGHSATAKRATTPPTEAKPVSAPV